MLQGVEKSGLTMLAMADAIIEELERRNARKVVYLVGDLVAAPHHTSPLRLFALLPRSLSPRSYPFLSLPTSIHCPLLLSRSPRDKGKGQAESWRQGPRQTPKWHSRSLRWESGRVCHRGRVDTRRFSRAHSVSLVRWTLLKVMGLIWVVQPLWREGES